MTSEPTTEALERIDTWRQRLSDQTVVSASEVQNRLFDLYGDLEPLPQLEKLKPWISLTIQRELFSATELEAFLAELEGDLSTGDLDSGDLGTGLGTDLSAEFNSDLSGAGASEA